MTTAQYEVIGCNDEQTVCDHSGRQGLKKTVILRSNDGEIVRFGSDCALRAAAVPGVRTKAQMDRKVYAAQVEVEALRFRYEQAVAVLSDPIRLQRNFCLWYNNPARHDPWTRADERARWENARDEAAAELGRASTPRRTATWSCWTALITSSP